MKCKEEAYSPRRLTIRDMQCKCNAMPCHAALPHPIQPILEQAVRWESKPEKKAKGTRAAYCLHGQEKQRLVHPSHPNPSMTNANPNPNPNRPLPHARGRKTKPRLRKVAPVFKKASRSFRSFVAKTINTSDLDCHVVPRDHGYCG